MMPSSKSSIGTENVIALGVYQVVGVPQDTGVLLGHFPATHRNPLQHICRRDNLPHRKNRLAENVAFAVPLAALIRKVGIGETLSYYNIPSEHWRRLKTNDHPERLMREIRRRTRVAGAFPNRKRESSDHRFICSSRHRQRAPGRS